MPGTYFPWAKSNLGLIHYFTLVFFLCAKIPSYVSPLYTHIILKEFSGNRRIFPLYTVVLLYLRLFVSNQYVCNLLRLCQRVAVRSVLNTPSILILSVISRYTHLIHPKLQKSLIGKDLYTFSSFAEYLLQTVER